MSAESERVVAMFSEGYRCAQSLVRTSCDILEVLMDHPDQEFPA